MSKIWQNHEDWQELEAKEIIRTVLREAPSRSTELRQIMKSAQP